MPDTNTKRDDRYPFGVLTIPWYLAGSFLAVWTFGPLYIYHFSFVAADHGWGQGVFEWGAQDLAGYVGFGFVGICAVAADVVLAVMHRGTLKLSLPSRRDLLVPAVISTAVFSAPYVVVVAFYEAYQHELPYDGAWAAIAGTCSVGFAHFIVMNALVKTRRQTVLSEADDAAN